MSHGDKMKHKTKNESPITIGIVPALMSSKMN